MVRVGGNSPTVTLTFLNGQTGTYQIRGTHPKSLTKRIAEHLYDKVKLQVEAWWNAKTLEIENLYVLDLLEWQEVHLAQVYRENDERLPIALTFNSVEELLAEGEKDRRR